MAYLLLFLLMGLSAWAAPAETRPAGTQLLVPVVVTQGNGQPVTDLQLANFKVEGGHGLQADSVQLVAPETLGDPQHTVPVFILCDKFLVQATTWGQISDEVLQFLEEAAQKRIPVTVVANTWSGLSPVYDFGTAPGVLTEALAALKSGAAVSNPQVQKQLDQLKLFKAAPELQKTTNDVLAEMQLDRPRQLAQLLRRSPNRKALIWMTWRYGVGTGEYTKSWPAWSTTPTTRQASQTPGFKLEGPNAPSVWDVQNKQPHTEFTEIPPRYQQAIDSLNAAHVSVYPLQMWDRRNTQLTISDKYAHAAAAGLAQFAACTGGFSFKDYQNTTLAQAVAQVGTDFGPYYMLTITAKDVKTTDWIGLKVKVDRPSVTVRTAPGFLGLSPKAAAKVPDQP
jgi:VWFA-related protein